MRIAAIMLGLALASSGSAIAGSPRVVYLDGPTALDHLRATRPDHYARAQRILAAANRLCRPDGARVLPAFLDARDLSCSEMLLRTSNPPKREIEFRLDDVRYIALVRLTDDPPRIVAAH